jgi:hypothetical protein
MLKFVAERWEDVKNEKDGVQKALDEKFGFLYANQVAIDHIRYIHPAARLSMGNMAATSVQLGKTFRHILSSSGRRTGSMGLL